MFRNQFEAQTSVTYTINLLDPKYVFGSEYQLEKHETEIIEFLSTQKGRVFPPSIPYKYDESGNKFQLSYKSIVRPRGKNKEGIRIEIVTPDSLGAGGVGTVYPVTTLIPTNSNYFESKQKRVVKIQDPTADKDREEATIATENAKREGKISRKVNYLKAKKQIVSGNKYYLIMRKLPGMDLQKFFNSTWTQIFEFKKAIDIAINLIDALQAIHDENIIHRDITLRNIMLGEETETEENKTKIKNKDNDNIETFIFDFGLSKFSGEKLSREASGTPECASMEQFEGKESDKSTDTYQLGKLLGFLFGMIPQSFSVKKPLDREDVSRWVQDLKELAEKDTIFEDYSDSLNPVQNGWNVSHPAYNAIKNVLEDMTRAKKSDRISLAEAKNRLKEIYQAELAKEDELAKENEFKQILSALTANVQQPEQSENSVERDSEDFQNDLNEFQNGLVDLINALSPDLTANVQQPAQSKSIDLIAELNESEQTAPNQNNLTSLKIAEGTGKEISSNSVATDQQPVQSGSAVSNELNLKEIDVIKREEYIVAIKKNLAKLEQNAEGTTFGKKLNQLHSSIIAESNYADLIKAINRFSLMDRKSENDQTFGAVIGFLLMPSEGHDPLSQLRKNIKTAIIMYLQQTLTKKNIQKMDRAASTRRINDMHEILNLVMNPIFPSEEAVIKSIQDRIKTIEKGSFKTNFGLFKYFQRSELANCLQFALKKHNQAKSQKTERSNLTR